MSKSRKRSFLSSAITATAEVLTLWWASLFLPGGPPLVAARWLVGACGSTANFALNRKWAFRHVPGSTRGQIARYVTTLTAAVTLSTAAFALLLRLTPLDPRLAHITTMIATWLLFTYPCLSRWVFRSHTNPSPPPRIPIDTPAPPC